MRLISVALAGLFMTGCIVSSRRPVHHHHHNRRDPPPRVERRSGCPATHHMSGGVCVQNGAGRR